MEHSLYAQYDLSLEVVAGWWGSNDLKERAKSWVVGGNAFWTLAGTSQRIRDFRVQKYTAVDGLRLQIGYKILLSIALRA